MYPSIIISDDEEPPFAEPEEIFIACEIHEEAENLVEVPITNGNGEIKKEQEEMCLKKEVKCEIDYDADLGCTSNEVSSNPLHEDSKALPPVNETDEGRPMFFLSLEQEKTETGITLKKIYTCHCGFSGDSLVVMNVHVNREHTKKPDLILEPAFHTIQCSFCGIWWEHMPVDRSMPECPNCTKLHDPTPEELALEIKENPPEVLTNHVSLCPRCGHEQQLNSHPLIDHSKPLVQQCENCGTWWHGLNKTAKGQGYILAHQIEEDTMERLTATYSTDEEYLVQMCAACGEWWHCLKTSTLALQPFCPRCTVHKTIRSLGSKWCPNCGIELHLLKGPKRSNWNVCLTCNKGTTDLQPPRTDDTIPFPGKRLLRMVQRCSVCRKWWHCADPSKQSQERHNVCQRCLTAEANDDHMINTDIQMFKIPSVGDKSSTITSSSSPYIVLEPEELSRKHSRIKCNYCEYSAFKSRMRKHITTEHPLISQALRKRKGRNWDQCLFCSFAGWKHAVKQHIYDTHEKSPQDLRRIETKCTICEFRGSMLNMKEHYESEHPGKEVLWEIQIRKVPLDIEPSTMDGDSVLYCCAFCEYIGFSQSNLKDHYESVHPDKKMVDGSQERVQVTGEPRLGQYEHLSQFGECEGIRNTKNLVRHVESGHPLIFQEVSGSYQGKPRHHTGSHTSHQDSLQTAMVDHLRTSQNLHCQSETKSAYGRRKPTILRKPTKCAHCNKSYYGDLKTHIRYKHPQLVLARNTRQSETSGGTGVTVRCAHCEYQDSKVSLKAHIETVHLLIESKPEKVFKCTLCPHETYRKASLDGHLRTAHSQGRGTCYFCDFKCSSRRAMREHMHTQHSDIKQYKCKECDYSSPIKLYLKRHFKIKHRTSYNCKICDSKFCRPLMLKKHLINDHNECPQCDEIFFTSSMLKEHMDEHKKVKALKRVVQTIPDAFTKTKCPLCDMRFKREYFFRKHLTTKHAKDIENCSIDPI